MKARKESDRSPGEGREGRCNFEKPARVRHCIFLERGGRGKFECLK